jgi:hypothetical protein
VVDKKGIIRKNGAEEEGRKANKKLIIRICKTFRG